MIDIPFNKESAIANGYVTITDVALIMDIPISTIRALLRKNYDSINTCVYRSRDNGIVTQNTAIHNSSLEKLDELAQVYEERVKPETVSTIVDSYVYLGVLFYIDTPIGYKVGVSSCPYSREKSLNSSWKSAGVALSIKIIRVSDKTALAYKLETSLHQILKYHELQLSLDTTKDVKLEGATEFFKYDNKVLDIVNNVCTITYTEGLV